MGGGDPKFCRFLGKKLRKHISALQIDHNPQGTILYIPLKKTSVYATFCPERQYIKIYQNILWYTELVESNSEINVCHYGYTATQLFKMDEFDCLTSCFLLLKAFQFFLCLLALPFLLFVWNVFYALLDLFKTFRNIAL